MKFCFVIKNKNLGDERSFVAVAEIRMKIYWVAEKTTNHLQEKRQSSHVHFIDASLLRFQFWIFSTGSLVCSPMSGVYDTMILKAKDMRLLQL